MAPDTENSRMRMRRSQHLEVQQPLHRNVHRVAGLPCDDRLGEGVTKVRPTGMAGDVLLDGTLAGKRIGDGAISGTAAKITLERVRQVGALIGIQYSGSHDHAGGAEAALECLRIQEGLLHRVQRAVLRQPFDCGDIVPGGAECGRQTGMHRRPVEPDRAGATIAGIAALLHAEAAMLAQKGAQTLARFRPGFEPAVIDAEGNRAGVLVGPVRDVVHAPAPDLANSARICSAK